MKIKTLISISLALVILIFADACKVKNPLEGAKLILNYDILNTYINVQFQDAATGNLIGFNDNTQVRVIVTGDGSEAVLDNTGVQKDEYKSSNGFMGLALNPNTEFVPSNTNPIKFTLVAKLDGYISTSQSMTITEEGTYNVKIVMTDISNPPNGVIVQEEKGVGNLEAGSGTVQEEIGIKTQGDELEIIIPEGTVIKDGNGNPLGGSLDITLVYFDNLLDESLAAFPGGLMTRVNQNGETLDGAFFSAGFAAIEITDENGVSAETFEENPVLLNMGIQAPTYNPETQASIAAGDQLPVYSYNTDNGEWTLEQTVTVESGSRSDFMATAELTHLSYWNFDWFWSFYCTYGVQFKFVGDYAGCGCAEVSGIMRKQADNTFFSYIYFYACDGQLNPTYYAPADMPVYIDWIDNGCSGIVVQEDMTYIDNLCSTDIIEVTLTTNGANRTNITVDASAYCVSNPDVEIRPTYGAYFRPVDSYCWRWSFMYNGYVEICDVEIGKEYVIGTYFNGEWYETNYTVQSADIFLWDIQLPSEACEQIF
ncbi:MAG: hypothetical protein C0598_12470 [Marinilabiliales bacterium]|nr:MAG: hypothetical protein C0598_12470 [Marinilabiliales bacterium]